MGPGGPGTWWGLAGLLCLVAAAYGQTLGFDLVWDDHSLLVSGPTLQSRLTWRELLASPQSAYYPEMSGADRVYRPLLALTARLDRTIWGLRPGGFHLSNVLAHLAVVLVLWRLAWRLTGSRMAAFTAGALLAVHPSAVEPAAFIGGRVDLFVALGMALVLLLVGGCLGPGGGWRLGGALLGFASALGSKETAMVIPAIVTWAAWAHPQWFVRSGEAPRWRPLAVRVAPFWIVLVLYLMFRQAVIGRVVTVPIGLADLPAQLPRALVATATYAEMTVIPRPVTGYIEVGLPTRLADARILLGLAVVALLLAGLFWLRRSHAPSALALGWYAAALVPPSNVLPIYWKDVVNVAERSLYPALAGWCLFVVVGVHALRAAAWKPLARSRALGNATAAAVLVVFLVVTAVKVAAWRDDVTLWTSAVASDPAAVILRLKLATALAQAGNLERAYGVVQQARGDFPADPRVAYLDGLITELRGNPREAYRRYERAIALGAQESVVFRQAAAAAARLQAWEQAGRWFAVAADRFPREAWPQVGLAWYDERRGRADLAQAHFDRAARLEPNTSERLVFYAHLLLVEGRTGEAARALRDAVAADPFSVPARRELALIAEREGRTADAIAEWRRVVDALPGSHRSEGMEHLRRLERAAAGRRPGGQP